MSRSGTVWDNSANESLNAARADVFDHIERFCNPKRRHSKLGYLNPIQFEACAVLSKLAGHQPRLKMSHPRKLEKSSFEADRHRLEGDRHWKMKTVGVCVWGMCSCHSDNRYERRRPIITAAVPMATRA